jgi:outer membrane protein TolC
MSLTPSLDEQASGGQDTTSITLGASVQVRKTLWDGGASTARVIQAQRTVDTYRAALTNAERDAIRDFVGLWADVRDAEASRSALAAADRAAEQSLRGAEARYRAGTATRVDTLTAASSKAQAERELLAADSTLRKARGLLAQRLGLEADTALGQSGNDLDSPLASGLAKELSLSGAAAELRERHPQLISQRAKVAELEASVRATDADGGPTLTMTGQAGPSWTRTRSSLPLYSSATTTFVQVGLTWSMTLSDGGARRSRSAQAREQLAASREQFEVLARSLLDTLWSAYTHWHDADATELASRVALNAAQESEAAQRARYAAGLGTLNELLTAQSDLAQRRQQASQAAQQRLRSRVALAHALGRLSPSTPGLNP